MNDAPNADLFRIASIALAALSVAGCAGYGGDGLTCRDVILFEPAVQLVYPSSGASAVPTGSPVLVYGSDLNGGSVAQVPLSLATSNADPAPVKLDPTAVPSPIPSPDSAPFPGSTPYGVALPPLRSATTYIVLAKLTQVQCGTSREVEVNIGAFTTQ